MQRKGKIYTTTKGEKDWRRLNTRQDKDELKKKKKKKKKKKNVWQI